jgi:hypothetical protein
MPDVFDPADSEAPATLAPHLARLSDDELTTGWDDRVTAVRRAEWERLAYEVEIERRRMWQTDGTGSLRSWICTRSAEGDRSATTHSRIARTLPRYPHLSAALRSGTVSLEHIRALLTLAHLTEGDSPPLSDADLVALGERHTVPQLETLCRAARRVNRGNDLDARQQRAIRWWVDDRGTFHLSGRLHGVEGLTVTELLSSMATDMPADPATGTYDPFDARCADALVQLCSGPDGQPEATIIIHAPLDAFDLDDATGVPVTPTRTVIANDTLRRLACDSRLRLSLHNPAGNTVGIGRLSRSLPTWLAQELRWRDHTCRFPGCEHTRWLQGHHLWHWPDGGPTNLDNLALLCFRHHHLVHEGGWKLTGHPDHELVFTSPTGTRHSSNPPPRPDTHLRPPRRTRRTAPPPEPSHGPTQPDGP